MQKYNSIIFLRFACSWSVFFLHWFAKMEWRNYIWIWSFAVPCFLYMSSFIYGNRYNEGSTKHFSIRNRFKSLVKVYYPFITFVFLWYLLTDFSNCIQYTRTYIGYLLFATDVVKDFPNCGHLWFMQTLIICYVVLFFLLQNPQLLKKLQNNTVQIVLFICLLLIGIVYKGPISVFLYFYILVFIYAPKIFEYGKRTKLWKQLIIIFSLFFMLSIHYENIFRYGIFLNYIHRSFLAISLIAITIRVFENKNLPSIITYLSDISMEVYLFHHLFVFSLPLYCSLTITLFLSVILHFTLGRIYRSIG